jgi:hypothetical protein
VETNGVRADIRNKCERRHVQRSRLGLETNGVRHPQPTAREYTVRMHLLSLDPSVRSPGAALWEITGAEYTTQHTTMISRLVAVEKVKVLTNPQRPDGTLLWESDAERWLYVAEKVLVWATLAAEKASGLNCTMFAFERPQIYRETKSRGDHNDLPPLAAVGTAVACMLRARLMRLRVLSPTPAEWSGQLPKATTGDPWRTPRGRRIASRLREDEIACVPAQHDCIDAVGIGLHVLGRLGIRRAWQAATSGT